MTPLILTLLCCAAPAAAADTSSSSSTSSISLSLSRRPTLISVSGSVYVCVLACLPCVPSCLYLYHACECVYAYVACVPASRTLLLVVCLHVDRCCIARRLFVQVNSQSRCVSVRAKAGECREG